MIKPLVFSCIVLLQAAIFAQEYGPVVMAVRFVSDEKSRQAGNDIYNALSNIPQGKYRYLIKKGDSIMPVTMPDSMKDEGELKKIARGGKDAGAAYVMLGRAYSYQEGIAVQVYLLSTAGEKVVYKTECAFSGTDSLPTISILSGRINLFLTKTTAPSMKECTASRGESTSKISLSWEPSKDTREYAVYRSCFEQGPYLFLATIEGASYDDVSAEPGLQYWYGIGPVVNSVPCEPGKAASGYRTIEHPKSLDLDRLTKEKTRPLPVSGNDREKQKAAAYAVFLKSYYKNPVELSIVFNIIRSYVKKGAVIVLNNLNQYDIDVERREIIMMDEEYRYAVTFTSSRLIRLFIEAQMKSPDPENKKELTDKLVKNMTAFCIYRDERSITDANNCTRIVPCYDAVGISTELNKNYSGWKKNTMVFGTGNKELEEKIKQARKKNEN